MNLFAGRWYQCRLTKGNAVMTAWIQNKGGRLKDGVEVELLPTRELWTVVTVYDTASYTSEGLARMKNQTRASLPSVKPMEGTQSVTYMNRGG